MSKLYNNLKLFHFHDKLRSIENKEISAPVHIRLKPINKCNHRCYYCCYRNDSLYLSELVNEQDMIPKEKMEEIAGDLIDMKVKAVTFTGGGEPLLYPYFSDTAERLSDGGIKIATLTNGGLLSGKNTEVLAEKATWVRVSMDAANPESYAKQRDVSLNEFDKVCSNIENFAKIKSSDCELGISFIVDKNNYKEIYSFLKMMKSRGVNHVKLSEVVVSTQGSENNEYFDSIYNEVKENIAKADSDLSDETFSIIDRVHEFEDNYDKKYNWCPFIHYLIVIAADQTVYTCQDKAYTTKGILGSIREKNFKDFWFSPENQARMFSLNPSQDCDHHCVAHGKNLMLLDYLNVNKDHLDFV